MRTMRDLQVLHRNILMKPEEKEPKKVGSKRLII